MITAICCKLHLPSNSPSILSFLLHWHNNKSQQDNRLKYDSVVIAFPGHSLSDEIYMNKAEIYIKLDNISEAIKMYSNIIDEWSYDILADDAIYLLAKLYDNILNDQFKAKNLYERIILEYNSGEI